MPKKAAIGHHVLLCLLLFCLLAVVPRLLVKKGCSWTLCTIRFPSWAFR